MTEKPKPLKRATTRKRTATHSKSRGGRPPFQPTLEQRVTVEQMKFCGDSEKVIAMAIGVDVDTLRKHFDYELTHGHANRRKEVVALLFESAQKGNVSAQKRLDEMGRAAGAAESVKGRERPVVLGKKKQQQQAAERVGGKFAPPEPPKLVVDNRT